MEMTHVITGTVSVDPGMSLSRTIDVPPGLTDPVSRVLSKAQVSDSANVSHFKFVSFAGASSLDASPPRDTYFGARFLNMNYSSTATGPIDIDFQLVFLDQEELEPIEYRGN